MSDEPTVVVNGKRYFRQPKISVRRAARMFDTVQDIEKGGSLSDALDEIETFLLWLVPNEQFHPEISEFVNDADMADVQQIVHMMNDLMQTSAGRPKDAATPSSSWPSFETNSPSLPAVSLPPAIAHPLGADRVKVREYPMVGDSTD